jgi:hypothetical protein
VLTPHFIAGTGSSNQNGNSSCNGGDRYQNRRLGSYPRFRAGTPNWSFVFDPAGRLCYYWSMVVSLAFLYNFWVIIYRFAFQEINGQWLRSASTVDVPKYILVGSVFVPILQFDEVCFVDRTSRYMSVMEPT